MCELLLSDCILKLLLAGQKVSLDLSLLLVSLQLLLFLPLEHGRLELFFHALEFIFLLLFGLGLQADFFSELLLQGNNLFILLLNLCKSFSVALLKFYTVLFQVVVLDIVVLLFS